MSIAVTAAMLKRIAPAAKPDIIDHLAPALTQRFPMFGVSTDLRAAHFLAQAAHETAGFKTLVEYGGTAYFSRYDGRKDLGNTQSGDGARYRGRGIFQITGRYNYGVMGRMIGIDLVKTPERAAEPDISVQTALHYWANRRLNPIADNDDIVTITKKINGGRNGLADRQAKLIRAKAALQGRPASEAVREIQQESAKAKTAAQRAATGSVAVGAGGGGGNLSQKPADGFGAGGFAVFAIIAGAMIYLGLRAWWKRRDAQAFAADAALGTGEGAPA